MNARLLRHQANRQLSHEEVLLWYLHAVSICSLCHWEYYQSNFYFRLVCSCYSANQCAWESSLISSYPRILGKCYLIHCWEFHKRFSLTHLDYGQSTFNNDSWLKFNLTISGFGILYILGLKSAANVVGCSCTSHLHSTTSISEKRKRHSLFAVNILKVWYGVIW